LADFLQMLPQKRCRRLPCRGVSGRPQFMHTAVLPLRVGVIVGRSRHDVTCAGGNGSTILDFTVDAPLVDRAPTRMVK
jgi:hypothetical protein